MDATVPSIKARAEYKGRRGLRSRPLAIFKRGRVYWFHFWFNGEHIQKSTKQGNPRVARQMEAACKTALAKGEVGIVERKPTPTLREFEKRFMDSVKTRCAEKPETVRFYQAKMIRFSSSRPWRILG